MPINFFQFLPITTHWFTFPPFFFQPLTGVTVCYENVLNHLNKTQQLLVSLATNYNFSPACVQKLLHLYLDHC